MFYRRKRKKLTPYRVLFYLLKLLIDFIIYVIIDIYRTIKWILNYFHFRKINYSYFQIVKLINSMTPRQFEVFCAELFKANGFHTYLTPQTCDGGKDIIIDGHVFVECKHYSESNYVGREICQKLIGAMVGEKIEHGMIITTGKIHRNAIEYAKKVGNIKLVDMKELMEMVKSTKVEKIPLIMNNTFNGHLMQL